jgi:hypothetical protein
MARYEVDVSDLPSIAAWGPPRDYAPTPGEDAYEQGIKPHYWALAFLLGIGLWGLMAWGLYTAMFA